jgi:signal transduction histidine kinase
METQSAFMAAAAAAVLVAAVLVRRRDRAGLLLGALSAAFGGWALARGATQLGMPWGEPVERTALCLLGPLTLGFAWTLGAVVPRAALCLPALGVLGLGIAALPLAGPPLWPLLRFVPPLWAAGLVTTSALLLFRRPVPPLLDDSPEFTRLRYVATSHGLVVGAAAADAILGALDAPRGVTYFAALLYLYIAYVHLSRVRVADLRQLLGNTLALGLLAATLASFFAALHLWVGASLDLFVLNAFLACFVLLLFHEPVRRTVQYVMERWLVRSKIALERSLEPLGSRLTQVLTLDELLREFLRTLERTERVTSSSIFLRDDPQMGFQLAASIGLSPRPRVNLIRDPVFVEALQHGHVLIREELERATTDERARPGNEQREIWLRTLSDLDAQLLIPLLAGRSLVGFWTLTDANAVEPFSTEEVRLLRDLADRAAVSIETSKTFERIRARDRLVTLGEMSAGLAHEIRNPIATIRGALALLEEPGTEDPDDIREMIQEEVARLNRVVGLFLDYARPSPSLKISQDPGKVLERAVEDARPFAATRTARVVLDAQPGLPPLPLDAEQLERVVSNLVRNASEAAGPEGTVRVGADVPHGADEQPLGLEVTVEDDGAGMDDETLARAFVPFFTTKDQGVGLGLALCERLVRAQGGEIDIRSEPSRGTRVRVWIPIGTGAAVAPEVAE